MKLYKALKLKKSLIGEITKIKELIKGKNSYLEGSINGEKFNVDENWSKLIDKINELTTLKYMINEANRDIQSKIYLLGEYKALIVFWNEVSVVEGIKDSSYSDNVKNYIVSYDEAKRDAIVKSFQDKVDKIQDELDEYNFSTEIPWNDSKKEN